MAKKANGEGSISWDASRNKYRAQITDPNGKRILKRFVKKSEATEWLTVIKAEIYKDTYIAETDITLGEWVAEYLNTYVAPNVRQSTLKRYIQTAKFLEPIADITLQTINALTVQKFMNNLPNMSDSSKTKVYRLLKSAIRKGYELEMTKKDIMVSVIPPRNKTKAEMEIITQEEIESALKYCRENMPRYYTFFLTAFGTGARLGELLGLKCDCVRDDHIFINNSIIANTTIDVPPKTKSGIRKITLSPKIIAMLRAECEPDISPYVFHTKNGTPIAHRNMERTWDNIMKGAGNVYKRFHSIRHTHATRLLADGIPLLEVSKRLGHANAAHTLTLYGHAIPGYDKMIANKVDDIFFKGI